MGAVFNLNYNHFHNNVRLFDVLPNFFSPQVKRQAIIVNKQGICMRVASRVAERRNYTYYSWDLGKQLELCFLWT